MVEKRYILFSVLFLLAGLTACSPPATLPTLPSDHNGLHWQTQEPEIGDIYVTLPEGDRIILPFLLAEPAQMESINGVGITIQAIRRAANNITTSIQISTTDKSFPPQTILATSDGGTYTLPLPSRNTLVLEVVSISDTAVTLALRIYRSTPGHYIDEIRA